MRNYLPWVEELSAPKEWKGNYIWQGGAGDAMLQSSYTFEDSLEESVFPGQRPEISFKTYLAWPLHAEVNQSANGTVQVTQFLKWLSGRDKKFITYLIYNLLLGINGCLSFWTLYMAGWLLFNSRFLAVVCGLAVNSVFIFTLHSTYASGILGYLLIALGYISIYRLKDKELRIRLLPCLFLFMGAALIGGSGVGQYILYLPLICLFFSPWIVARLGPAVWIISGLAIALGLLSRAPLILEFLNGLAESNKGFSAVAPLEERHWSPFPLGLFMPVEGFLAYFGTNGGRLGSLGTFALGHTPLFNGFAAGLLGLSALIFLRDRLLALGALCMLLYFMGPLQYLLSVSVKGPFATESSVRMASLFIPVLFFLAVYAYRHGLHIRFKWLVVLITAVVGIGVLGSIGYGWARYHHLFLIGVWALIAMAGLVALAFSRRELDGSNLQKALFLIAFLFVPFSMAFLPGTASRLAPRPISWAYHQEPGYAKAATDAPGPAVLLSGDDSPNNRTMHPNFWMDFEVPSVNGYRNPPSKLFSNVYWYSQTEADETSGLSHRAALAKQERDEVLNPIALRDGWITPPTSRMLDLFCVRLLAVSGRAAVPSDWELKFSKHQVSIYAKKQWAWGRVVHEIVRQSADISDYDALTALYAPGFDLNQAALVPADFPELPAGGNSVIEDVATRSDCIDIQTRGTGGLVVTPIPYYRDFHLLRRPGPLSAVTVESAWEEVPVRRVNYGFTGFIPQSGADGDEVSTYRLIYRKKPWTRILQDMLVK